MRETRILFEFSLAPKFIEKGVGIEEICHFLHFLLVNKIPIFSKRRLIDPKNWADKINVHLRTQVLLQSFSSTFIFI